MIYIFCFHVEKLHRLNYTSWFYYAKNFQRFRQTSRFIFHYIDHLWKQKFCIDFEQRFDSQICKISKNVHWNRRWIDFFIFLLIWLQFNKNFVRDFQKMNQTTRWFDRKIRIWIRKFRTFFTRCDTCTNSTK